MAKSKRIDYLRPGDRVPDFPPRRYPDAAGYIRLRWRVGVMHEVEVREHRVRDGVVVDSAHIHHDNHVRHDNRDPNLVPMSVADHMELHAAERRRDWDKITAMYLAGMSTTQIEQETGYNCGNVSRILRKAGVEIRPSSHRYPLPDRESVEAMYELCTSAVQLAERLGVGVSTARRALKVYGLPSYPSGRPRSYNGRGQVE